MRVDDDRPDHHQPLAKIDPRQFCQDAPAVLAGKLRRERITEQRLAPLGLERAEARHHEGRV
jgi:hypothetical protein